jgi:pimeloyl-ACP methyl ester carboxylesterase
VSDRRLTIAEQSYFWLGVERTTLPHGTVVSGEQMYVEYQVPLEVRHSVPVVLVHGGGGQGLDYLGRPDGGPGWATLLIEAGYTVYVVDRPGLGRSPFYPDLLGPMGPTPTYEMLVSLFTAPEKADRPLPNAHLHSRWPGSGEIGDPAVDASAASSGPSMADLARSHELWRKRGRELLERIGPAVVVTHSAAGPFGWVVADECPDLVRAIVAVEPAGPPFSSFGPGPGLVWGLTASPLHFDPPPEEPGQLELVAMAPPEGGRPYQLQAEPARKLRRLAGIPIAVVTSEASSFTFNDPATVAFLVQAGCDATHLRLADHGVHGNGHFIMHEENAEEALQPIVRFLSEHVDDAVAGPGAGEAGFAGPGAGEAGFAGPGAGEAGSAGPGAGEAGSAGAGAGEAGSAGPGGHPPLELADQGHFWTGVERRRQGDGGTVPYGPMFVRYQVPADRRHEHPFVLVHGGGGQGLAFMGRGSGEAGWNEELLREGWATYIVDRPGHGRAPYDPSVLGEWLPPAAYEPTVGLFEEAAGPGGQWDGSGTVGDPAVDQFFAQQGPTQADAAVAHALNRSRGAELLDRIGPAVILTHSAGGPFGWVVADERPELVRAIVAVEAAGMPFARRGRFGLPWGLTASPVTYDPPVSDPAELELEEVPASVPAGGAGGPPGPVPGDGTWTLQRDPPRRLVNLAKVPIAIVTAERSRLRTGSLAAMAYLRQAGCSVTHLDLPALGIFGNGHFMPLEKNRAAVLEVILRWVEDVV